MTRLSIFRDSEVLKNGDFGKYTPDIVVVAIGQNDANPDNYMPKDYNGGKAKRWRAHYESFVRKLMQLYPSAHIILATTILMHECRMGQSDR